MKKILSSLLFIVLLLGITGFQTPHASASDSIVPDFYEEPEPPWITKP